VAPETGRIGVLSSSARFRPSAALVRAMRSILPVHILPDGITSVDLLTAAMASSGEIGIAQLVGIERHDDGALIPAERRRRGNAGQRREQRTHAVEREILQLALRVRGAAEDQQARPPRCRHRSA
jgi:hypothetical protein